MNAHEVTFYEILDLYINCFNVEHRKSIAVTLELFIESCDGEFSPNCIADWNSEKAT